MKRRRYRRSREKFVKRVIWPAVRGQSCPICLQAMDVRSTAVLSACKHAYCLGCIGRWSSLRRKCPLCNADFNSWFSHLTLSSGRFHKQHLPPLTKTTSKPRFQEEHPQRSVINGVRNRTRPLPWRRSFGRPGSVGDDVIADRKLRWRSSIYVKRLQAVPLSPRNQLEQNTLGNNGVKERILQRIEPWIRRELQAILGGTDPSIIVRVAASLYIGSLEVKVHAAPGQAYRGDNFLAPLQPFLLDRTYMFWHELREVHRSFLSRFVDFIEDAKLFMLEILLHFDILEYEMLIERLSKRVFMNSEAKFVQLSWRHGHGDISFIFLGSVSSLSNSKNSEDAYLLQSSKPAAHV